MIDNAAAGRYATALYELAQEKSLMEDIYAQLNDFDERFAKDQELRRIILSRTISATEKKNFLENVFSPFYHRYVLNFFAVVLDKDRQDMLPDIIAHFRETYNRDMGLLPATLITAKPLAEEKRIELADALSRAYGKTILFTSSIDPSLLGGAVIRVGDEVIDGSLKRQLHSLKAELIK